jgi:hypothetical protein
MHRLAPYSTPLLLVALTIGCMGISKGPAEPDTGTGSADAPSVDFSGLDGFSVEDVSGGAGSGGGSGAGESGSAEGGGGGGSGSSNIEPPSEETLATCDKSPADLVADSTRRGPGPRSQGYVPPSDVEIEALEQSLVLGLESHWAQSLEKAREAGYAVCQTDETDAPTVVFFPSQSTTGRARFAIRLVADASPVFAQAPHPLADHGTLEQAVSLFGEGARALLVAGSHRCANSTTSTCDGGGAACEETTPGPRVSDSAHHTDTAFQAIHRTLVAEEPDLLTVGLHTFEQPGISLSDGTTGAVSTDAPVARLGGVVQQVLPETRITYCNAISDRLHAERACGEANVQGRFVNGSPSACKTAADPGEATGRYLQVTQGPDVRQHGPELIEALARAFRAR